MVLCLPGPFLDEGLGGRMHFTLRIRKYSWPLLSFRALLCMSQPVWSTHYCIKGKTGRCPLHDLLVAFTAQSLLLPLFSFPVNLLAAGGFNCALDPICTTGMVGQASQQKRHRAKRMSVNDAH